MTIRGRPNDEAVLITQKDTFSIKAVQTSNSFLILAPASNPVCMDVSRITEDSGYAIIETTSGYMELNRTIPNLQRLRLLLNASPYDGSAELGSLYGTTELQSVIQASDEELWTALGDLDAILIQGSWKVLHLDYMKSILTSLIYTAQADRFPLDAIPQSVALKVSQEDEVPLDVVMHVLRIFSHSGPSESSESVFNLKEEKVGPFYGKTLLSEIGQGNLYAFTVDWRLKMPPDFDVDIKMLDGHCLIDVENGIEVIRWWSRDDLSADAKTRFEQIFQEREKWRAHDLVPFLEDLAPDQKKMDALLLKFARVSTGAAGERFYTRRFN